jgi:hypothetical protein
VLEFFARTYPVEYMESVEALLQASYAGFRVVEVPVAMYEREGGKPSTVRLKLVYHYVRLLVMLLVGAKRAPHEDELADAAAPLPPAAMPPTEPEHQQEPEHPERPTVTSERSP